MNMTATTSLSLLPPIDGGHVMPVVAKIGSLVFPRFKIRPLLRGDTPSLCSWVCSRQALQLVSGDDADKLTDDILVSWIEKAEACLIVSRESDNQPVGFSTLSVCEVSGIPQDYIEQCHVIVDPNYRYLRIGMRLCRAAISTARNRGYRFICGRVVPTNRYGLALVRAQRSSEFTGMETWTSTGFRWFRLAL